jgi:hypothetical protein
LCSIQKSGLQRNDKENNIDELENDISVKQWIAVVKKVVEMFWQLSHSIPSRFDSFFPFADLWSLMRGVFDLFAHYPL